MANVHRRVTATPVGVPNFPSAPGKSLRHHPPPRLNPGRPRAALGHCSQFRLPWRPRHRGPHRTSRLRRSARGADASGRQCVSRPSSLRPRAVCGRRHLCSDSWAVPVWGCLWILECKAVCERVCSPTPGECGERPAGSHGRRVSHSLTLPHCFPGGHPVSWSCPAAVEGASPTSSSPSSQAPGPSHTGKGAALTLCGFNSRFPDLSAASGRSLKTAILS